MSLELDHAFICVDDMATAEQALGRFGIQFDLHAVHGGQGTANACAFFDNAYLELLSRHDEEELRAPAVRPLALWERIHSGRTGASPFGIALRPVGAEVPIKTWPYEAPFLPRGSSIPIVTPPDTSDQPLIFVIPPALPIRLRSPQVHRGKHRRLTRVVVSGPGVSMLSADVLSLCERAGVTVAQGPEHRLELHWDDGDSGESHDFRPAVPLVLRW